MKISNVSNISLITLILLVFTWNVAAGESEVTWTNPDKYTDVRASNENRAKFKTRIFNHFEKHFSKLSEKLPDGQILKIDVTNVDLAGDVRFDTMDNIRVVRDLYIPRMTFTYEVVDSNKSIVDSGEVDLKDMGFMQNASRIGHHKAIYYEKKMLSKWFKNTFNNEPKLTLM